MPGGRPPFYSSADEMQAKIDEYFASEDNPTVTGLAIALGFTSRQAILNYEGKEEFVDTIKGAKLRIESLYESDLRRQGQVAGPIFALKNFGWTDSQKIEHTGPDGGAIRVTFDPAFKDV